MTEVDVLPETIKGGKGRIICFVSTDLLELKEVCKHTTRFIFSIDGNNDYKRQNINEAFKKLLDMSTI